MLTSESAGGSGTGPSLGVVMVDHGSRRAESNQAFEAFVEKFAARAPYRIVEAAHMELAEPSIGQAIARCVARGATRLVVCPFFLLPGKHWSQDIPALTREALAEHPGVTATVSAPIGGHDLLVDLLTDRIEHCQAKLRGEADACEVCAGAAGCAWLQGDA